MQAVGNEELERRFDEGHDVLQFADMSTFRRANQERSSRFEMDIKEESARALDRAAKRMGVNR